MEKLVEYKIVCAWCKKKIGSKLGKENNGEKITHSVCKKCSKKILSSLSNS